MLSRTARVGLALICVTGLVAFAAAGTAAAIAIDDGVDPRDIDPTALREALRRDGAIVDLDRAPTWVAA